MIRSPQRISLALRRPDGTLLVDSRDYTSLIRRRSWLGLPVIRGVVSFVEMLVIGLNALTFSAGVAAGETDSATERDRMSVVDVLVLVASLLLGVSLFVLLPMGVASLLGLANDPVSFNVVAGGARVSLFLAYLWGIGKLAEVERVFAFHGAEHKAVAAFEAGSSLTVGETMRFSRFHPRCGTSFVFLVIAVAIAFYALTDGLYAAIAGVAPELLTRFGIHLACLPVVAGLGYEFLKMTGKFRQSRWARLAAAPGLWLQRLTTRDPDVEQVAVALAAVRAAVGMPLETENASAPAA